MSNLFVGGYWGGAGWCENGGNLLVFEDMDVGELSVSLVVVESISDDEVVFDVESDEIAVNLLGSVCRFVE